MLQTKPNLNLVYPNCTKLKIIRLRFVYRKAWSLHLQRLEFYQKAAEKNFKIFRPRITIITGTIHLFFLTKKNTIYLFYFFKKKYIFVRENIMIHILTLRERKGSLLCSPSLSSTWTSSKSSSFSCSAMRTRLVAVEAGWPKTLIPAIDWVSYRSYTSS